jgi:hypothetical protein
MARKCWRGCPSSCVHLRASRSSDNVLLHSPCCTLLALEAAAEPRPSDFIRHQHARAACLSAAHGKLAPQRPLHCSAKVFVRRRSAAHSSLSRASAVSAASNFAATARRRGRQYQDIKAANAASPWCWYQLIPLPSLQSNMSSLHRSFIGAAAKPNGYGNRRRKIKTGQINLTSGVAPGRRVHHPPLE